MYPELKAVAEGMMLSQWEDVVFSQFTGSGTPEAAQAYLVDKVKYRFALNVLTLDRAKELLGRLGFSPEEIERMLQKSE